VVGVFFKLKFFVFFSNDEVPLVFDDAVDVNFFFGLEVVSLVVFLVELFDSQFDLLFSLTFRCDKLT